MKINDLKRMISDESGFSLLELVIATALLIIVAAAFATATLGSTASVKKNMQRQTVRSQDVGQIDSKISQTKKFKPGAAADSGYTDVASWQKANIRISSSTASSGTKGYRDSEAYIAKGNNNGVYSAYVTESD